VIAKTMNGPVEPLRFASDRWGGRNLRRHLCDQHRWRGLAVAADRHLAEVQEIEPLLRVFQESPVNSGYNAWRRQVACKVVRPIRCFLGHAIIGTSFCLALQPTSATYVIRYQQGDIRINYVAPCLVNTIRISIC
jgi:hypothetical protein